MGGGGDKALMEEDKVVIGEIPKSPPPPGKTLFLPH